MAHACCFVWVCAVNGSAQYGAYTFSQAINNNHGLNVNGQAMNFYWQRTPQARLMLTLKCSAADASCQARVGVSACLHKISLTLLTAAAGRILLHLPSESTWRSELQRCDSCS
jgi:hypothetical protein